MKKTGVVICVAAFITLAAINVAVAVNSKSDAEMSEPEPLPLAAYNSPDDGETYPPNQAKLYVYGSSYLTGNVGIGCAPNSGAKLDVAGTVLAHAVKVCLNQGCDYVFADDYPLMNLADLNDFIKTTILKR